MDVAFRVLLRVTVTIVTTWGSEFLCDRPVRVKHSAASAQRPAVRWAFPSASAGEAAGAVARQRR